MAQVKAKHGEKMIEVRLRFWSDGLAEDDFVKPKEAWSCGVAHLTTNKTHGITGVEPRHFHSLLDIGAVIEKLLIENGITLHLSKKASKYLS